VRLIELFHTWLNWSSRSSSTLVTFVKLPVLLALIAFMPVFLLPRLLTVIFIMGRTLTEYTSVVAMTTGEPARRRHGTLAPMQDPAVIRAGLAAIAAHDPGFTVSTLTGWTTTVTEVIGQSLVTLDATPARPVMANGLFHAHQAVLELRARAEVSCSGSWRATEPTVVAAARTPLLDEVRIRVHCTGTYTERHTPTGLLLREATTWSQDLTFGRSASAVSPPGGGLPAGHCPRCGAPLDIDQDGVCGYCRGIVTAGHDDWVLVAWQRADQ
jgi:hypothetical protein